MSFRRALFVAKPGRDPAAAFAVLRRVAPRLEHLLVLAPARRGLDALRATAAGCAPSIAVERANTLDAAALAARCHAEDADLLVFSSRSLRSAIGVARHRHELHVAILWAEGPAAPGPITEVCCVALDPRAKAAVEVFLRDHARPSMHLSVLSPAPVPAGVVELARQAYGIEARLEVSSPRDAESVRRWIEEWMRERPIDLVVCAGVATTAVVGALRSVPILVVPPIAETQSHERGALDVADIIDAGGPLRVRVDRRAVPGRFTPVDDGEVLAVVAGDRRVANGMIELDAGLGLASLAVRRVGDSQLEQIKVVRPGPHPLVLFDAEVEDPTLSWLRRLTAGTADALAVRLRPTRSCRAIRSRLEAAGLVPAVVDARAVLDEGDAFDVSQLLDPVRLARVASRLTRDGFTVAAIVHRGPLPPIVHGLAALAALDGPHDAETLRDAIAAASRSTAQAETTSGNHIELELDNAKARGWLLDAIERSTEMLHLQAYMAADDDVGARVEAALAAAAARGVAVRVLVDSLHGMYGSFGAENPLLARLATRPGVELRVVRPITTVPSLIDLKQRDHRKLVVADGRLALLGGRNLSHEYYTGFGEVALAADTPWRQVPWLDAGARIEGPLVAEFAAAFRDVWREAGGSDFPIVTPPPAGETPARVVVHRGLRDACTLEAYLALIDGARTQVTVVNGFPLVLELQHALLRALRRGVRVRVLSGHVTPTHAGTPFPGAMAAARTAATDFVHSRLDPIVAAGGDVYLFARRELPGWAPGLGVVHPHVHAKVVSVDGRAGAVGSANLDITASYWESELMLVVEDAVLVRAFEAEIDALLAASTWVDRHDPAWQRAAAGRTWMRHWPGVMAM